MVSTSEGLVYYCTVFLTAIIFLTEASAITTNYEKSTASNKTNESPPQEFTPQRTKLAPARSRGNNGLSKNQNQDRVTPLTITKLKANAKPQVPHDKSERELLILSNTGGENDVKDKGGGNGASTDDDDQKTLSQQVADGKYGLIQDEIFTVKPERQGILSYDVNPEVPKDNINNLGGLEPDDIWLAENHLLVLAGGGLNEMQSQWRPIDNYVAPSRPVQLPPNPKVPPPFPVQLTENGPVEYLKSDNRSPFVPFFNPLLAQYNFSKPQSYGLSYGKLPYGAGMPPLRSPLKPSLPYDPNSPLPPPIYVKPPPGADFIPPYLRNTNLTEVDEDDPSLYYPPPYDFYYPKDNTSRVPAGPLVPGIVLPPPPNFFSPLSNQTSSPQPDKIPIKPNKQGKQLIYNVDTKPSTSRPSEPSNYITYNDIINEVTYPDTNDDKITYADVRVNKVSAEEAEEWIPIPAPKPFYITGERKPVKSTLLVMMERPDLHGYNYDKPRTLLKTPKKPALKYLRFPDTPLEPFSSTTPIAPQLVSTKSSIHEPVYTTTPIAPYKSPPQTIKATYYFYEEPRFVDIEPNKFSTSSPLPATSILEFNNYVPAKQQDFKHASNFSEKRRKPTPMIPIYYLGELDNLVDLTKPMNLPYPSQTPLIPKTEFYTTTAKPAFTINKPNYDRPTPKPIFEYNYVASDYNVPANPIQQSTPQPQSYPVDYDPFYQPYQLFNPVAQYSKPVHSTVAPILFLNHYQSPYDTFDRPWPPNINLYNHIQYPTENPYYAFFTKEEADLIDDNTKKYFTIFGQKLKHNGDSTTPLSVLTPSPTTAGSPWNAKYEYPSYPSQSSTDNYVSYASSTTPAYSGIKNHHPPKKSTTHKPPSLEGDTNVNYVTPLPTENVDAEYITPKISKHIRPIVVEDLPPDVHERLKNIMNLQQQKTSSSNRMRYVLVDHNFDSQARPQNSINKYGIKYTTDRYERPSSAAPISLESDIHVNYLSKLPKNPDAEYLRGGDSSRSELRLRGNSERYERPGSSTPISLENDIRVNYLSKRPRNPDAEYIRGGGSSRSELRLRNNDERYEGPSSSTPISLENDIRVNYLSKLPRNPDAEYLRGGGSSRSELRLSDNDSDEHEERGRGRHKGQESRTQKPTSLANDILVNYKNKGRYTKTNPDAESIDSGERGGHRGGSSSSSNVISYSYPGVEHGHFYFLTPQETRLSHIESERHDFQSDAERPGSYFKRKQRKLEANSTKKESSGGEEES